MQKGFEQLKKLWKIFDSMDGGSAERFGNTILLSGELEHKSDIRAFKKAVKDLGLKPLIKDTKNGKKILILQNFSKKLLGDAEIEE